MAVTLVDSTIKGSTDGDSVTTDAIDTTGANLIVLAVAQYDVFGVVTDSKGNTWTRAEGTQVGFFATADFWYCLNPTVGSGHTFTHTPDNPGQYPTLAVSAWSGAGAVVVREGTASKDATSATSGIVAVEAGDLVVTIGSAENADALTVDSPYTVLDQVAYSASLHASLSMAYDIASGAGDVSATWHWTSGLGTYGNECGAAIFAVSAGSAPQIIGSAVFGTGTTVTKRLAVAMGLDGNTNVHDDANTFKVFGHCKVSGTTTLNDLEVTGTVTGIVLPNDSVSNAQLANMAQSTIKGRAAGAGTGDPTDLTATQATAVLNAFVGDSGSGGTKGLVPAPATGDATKFLKGDGTWATSSGSVSALDDLSDVAISSPSTDEVLAYNGSTWVNTAVPGSADDLPALTAPVDASFTWVNQGTSVSTQLTLSTGVTLVAQSGGSFRIKKITAPSTPYTITAMFDILLQRDSTYRAAGLIFRQNSNGHIHTFVIDCNSNNNRLMVEYYTGTGAGDFAGTRLNSGWDFGAKRIWLRITDNGTNRIYSYSLDGEVWVQAFSHARTTDLTPDEVGWTVYNGHAVLRHWVQT